MSTGRADTLCPMGISGFGPGAAVKHRSRRRGRGPWYDASQTNFRGVVGCWGWARSRWRIPTSRLPNRRPEPCGTEAPLRLPAWGGMPLASFPELTVHFPGVAFDPVVLQASVDVDGPHCRRRHDEGLLILLQAAEHALMRVTTRLPFTRLITPLLSLEALTRVNPV